MSKYKLWYRQPASKWSEGLPLGNGRMGAVIYGGADSETWSMTEVTYWSGQSEATITPSKGKADLEEMRKHFFAGDYPTGDRLAKQVLQPKKMNFGTNLPLCDIKFHFETVVDSDSFMRELDLDEAISHTSYKVNGHTIRREVFATHADDLVASRLWGDHPGSVSFTLGIEGRTEAFQTETVNNDTLTFRGQATEQVHSDGTCGVWSEGLIKVVVSGGTLRSEAGGLVVSGADEAWVYFAVNTDYRREAPWEEDAKRQVEGALAKGYSQLREDHILDYRELYARVDLDLGTSAQSSLPTNERIQLFKQGQIDDPDLFVLFFQYGRYLTIAGSRADSPLPLNLQGIWNDGEASRMEWSCDYHLDTNTEMNYYPTEIANLSECHLPLMRYIEELSHAGRSTASNFYGSEGWVAHVFSNAWGFTAPGWDTSWGLNVTGGLWIATHLMEHYDYTLDRTFLEGQAYPVLKEAAAFFLDYMTIHPSYGWLVTGPSNSPENHFYPSNKSQGVQQLSMGSTLDQVLVRDLFTFCLKSAQLLDRDVELQKQLTDAIAILPPLQVGKKGQLQEWLEDYEEAQPEHRHLSHLFALYPSNQITPQGTPELSAASRVTLENRMLQDELEDIEFTAALFGLHFARLHDGDRAHKHIGHLIGELCFDNLLTYSKPGIAGAETNIFVIDGNYGGTAAIAEMLLQSHNGEIHLLPALPEVWSRGSIKGLQAKGNMEVDVSWENGQLVEATIYSHTKGSIFIRFGNDRIFVNLEAGGTYCFNNQLHMV
ncbi:glycosyl hydrolase family 95 catalytic domain-containing protein [Paenibacillus paeoniae]|uniref:Glycoside hydrolase family 95 protein n=1 Tax=Paenibacillus paeoniae TaxID=2292705 RepID=A0A371PFS1_9BACL|nr:glycoside hydrolase family 95 protein [Paenibacillus paeoniae]REK74801.1 glycoside hydrolase family 95 protein [Paenibacillus paeoniae]